MALDAGVDPAPGEHPLVRAVEHRVFPAAMAENAALSSRQATATDGDAVRRVMEEKLPVCVPVRSLAVPRPRPASRPPILSRPTALSTAAAVRTPQPPPAVTTASATFAATAPAVAS